MKRTLTITPTDINISAVDVSRLIAAMEDFHTLVPCSNISVTRIGVSLPRAYTYKIVAIDLRIWKQTLTFDIENDPQMNFNVADNWRLSEFSRQRYLRDMCVIFSNLYPTIDKFIYTFT